MEPELERFKSELRKDNDNLSSMDSQLRKLNREWIRMAFNQNQQRISLLNREVSQIEKSFENLKYHSGCRIDRLINQLKHD